jgi:hypothetical protein
VIEQLARDFDEHVVSRGLASNGTMLELLVSPQGTWTMLISLPNGNSCFGAAGEMWEDLSEEPSAPKAQPIHGWYDSWCCDQRDCAPVPQGTTIVPAPQGYVVSIPGQEPRLFLQSAVRPSQDGEVHVCIYRGEARCLYMPAGA